MNEIEQVPTKTERLAAAFAAMSPRDISFTGGLAALTLGAMVEVGFGWGCMIGGACLFLTAVFGIAPSRGS